MITARPARQSLSRLLPSITLPDESSHFPQAGPSRPPHRKLTTTHPRAYNRINDPELRMATYPSQNNKKRMKSLVTAKNFAQGLLSLPKDVTPPPRSSTPQMQPGESPYSLISVRNTGKSKAVGPSLEDLERILGTPPDGPRYGEEYVEGYKKVVGGLENAFVKGQLKRLARDLGVTGGGKSKEGWVKVLMEHGGWRQPESDPELMKVESEQVYDLTPAELFLFMRETELLKDLITNQRIQFSGVVDVDDPTRRLLKAQAGGDKLLILSGAIQRLRESVRRRIWESEEIYDVEPSEGLIHVVSSVTGVHIAQRTDKEGGFVASSTSKESLKRALDLLRLAILRSSIIPAKTPIAVTPRSSPEHERQEYGYLPFTTPTSSPPPWETVTTPGAALSRIKKTSLWQSRPGRMEFTHRDQELENVEIEAMRRGREGVSSLEDYVRSLWNAIEEEEGETTTLTFGYILHHPLETESSLTPPLTSGFSLSQAKPILEDMRTRRPIFAPGQTPAMVHHNLSLSTPTQKIRRLRYRQKYTLDKVLTFEYKFPIDEVLRVVEKVEEKKGSGGSWIDELDGILEEMEREDRAREEMMRGGKKGVVEKEEADDAVVGGTGAVEDVVVENIQDSNGEERLGVPLAAAETDTTPEGISDIQPEGQEDKPIPFLEDGTSPTATISSPLTATLDYITEVDLMIPDRPIDVRLTTTSPIRPEGAVPEAIEQYFSTIPSQDLEQTGTSVSAITSPADLPQTIILQAGEEYLLESEEEVEVNESTLAASGVSIRTVRAKDLRLGVDRITTYTELHYPGRELPVSFWREFANISREVAPDAVSLKVKGDIFSGRS